MNKFWGVLGWLIALYFIGVIIYLGWYQREFWMATTFALAVVVFASWDKIKKNND
jgi:hypothetical protein